jgi:NADH:ubiquinone oxidoreductase subunit H
MSDFIEKLKNEPAMIGALVVSLLLTLGAWNVLDVTTEQLNQTENFITLLTTFLLPLISGYAVRSQVTPVRKLDAAEIELVHGVDGLKE